MTPLALEFYKCRRRKIFLLCLVVLVVQLLWVGFAFRQPEAEDLRQGWLILFYSLSIIDGVILPLTLSVLASRNGEMEHKGATFKLLETMLSPSRLYTAKLCWGGLILALFLLLRSITFLLLGVCLHFEGPIPWEKWALFTLISWAVSMLLYTLQQGLSLRFANQAFALIFGLLGSFLGLFSLFFPLALQRFLPWGYYGLLLLVRMEWDPASRITTYFWRQPLLLDVGLLLLWSLFFFCLGRWLFLRKEG